MSITSIEWTQRPGTKGETWNPTTGCNKVSAGCKNCYAEKMHKRLQAMGQQKYAVDFTAGVQCHEDALTIPLKWKTPRTVFVNSMSDLFHKDVPFEFIDKVFAVMKECKEHTFQILTKRPKRMLEWFQRTNFYSKLDNATMYMMQHYDGFHSTVCYQQNYGVEGFPLPNVWLGTSVENQEAADERIPYLLQVPAAVRFLSCEPLLGEIHFSKTWQLLPNNQINKIDWVITGGESGHNARPVHPEWIRSLRNQCQAANVPFFFKQWGEWQDGSEPNTLIKHIAMLNNGDYAELHNAYKGQSIKGTIYQTDEWNLLKPKIMAKVGKHKAGNVLDGKQHLAFPQ